MSKPKIIIVDDHVLFREGLKSLLKRKGIAEVIAEAGNGIEFLSLLDKYEPDIILMDIEMPEMNGVEATKRAIENNPDLNIIVLSMLGDEDYYYQMVHAGAKGFVLKKSDIIELENAFNEVISGRNYFSVELLKKIVLGSNRHRKLKEIGFSDREFEILKLICKGYTNEEIAENIHLSVSTVKNHKTSLLEKTSSKNTAGLIIYAIKNKVIEL